MFGLYAACSPKICESYGDVLTAPFEHLPWSFDFLSSWKWYRTGKWVSSTLTIGNEVAVSFICRCAEAFASNANVLKGMVLRQWHEQSAGLLIEAICNI